jgi:hypothetical protein
MPDAKQEHEKRCQQHQEKVHQYIESGARVKLTFGGLVKAYQEARQAVVNSGAVEVGEDGIIKSGWYNFDVPGRLQRVAPGNSAGIALTGGAVSIAAAIGTPVAAWTLVGALGTASTGAAIGGLSGAAATSATAAWFGGGAVAAGGLGMAAAPFVLSGIGAAAGLAMLATAGIIMARRDKSNEKEIKDADAVMEEAERRMKINQDKLTILQRDAERVSKQLIRTAAVLEYTPSDETVNKVGDALALAERLFPEFAKELPHARMYLSKPKRVDRITQTIVSPNSVQMTWKDPDKGDSEIKSYLVNYSEGFWGEEKTLQNKSTATFLHKNLKADKSYHYSIIAINAVGESEKAIFDAKTNP